MFNYNLDFYPTPANVIDQMLDGVAIEGKVFLEPSAGKGDIVEILKKRGAKDVIACENDKNLIKILQTHCRIVEEDFFKLNSDKISHIDCIVMNPPFSNGAAHILHAYNIAPDGCKIIALCNLQTIKNTYTKERKELSAILESYGQVEDLGDCFADAERRTDVHVGLMRIQKPGSDYKQEFDGFFMDDDPQEEQANGLIGYNVVRDLVNRYVESIKIFDQQLETAVKLNEMAAGYFNSKKQDLSISVNRGGVAVARNEFKKSMQKDGWQWIFSKLNLTKHTTRGLKEEINKFVEKQDNVPFTMKNIYKMLEIVIGTTGSRLDKAILEVFDKVTSHHDENRYNIEGWKTNSHYLLTKRFIMPSLTKVGWHGEIETNYSSHNFEMVEDLQKALCYITGDNYDDKITLDHLIGHETFLMKDGAFVLDTYYKDLNIKKCWREHELKNVDISQYPGCELVRIKKEWGQWFNWGYFKIRAYKKGTIHFEFLNEKVWADFNQRVAKLKGYPLPEKKKQTTYQDKQTGRKPEQSAYKPTAQQPVVLSTIRL